MVNSKRFRFSLFFGGSEIISGCSALRKGGYYLKSMLFDGCFSESGSIRERLPRGDGS
jgi:hypothetical protein